MVMCKDRTCAYMAHHATFHLICYETWLFSEKKMFWPFDPIPRLNVSVNTEYVLAWCSIIHSISFDMQPDHFQKNLLTFWPTPAAEGILKDRIHSRIHGVLCSIPFNLICNMTIFRGKIDLLTFPHDRGCIYEQKKYLPPHCRMRHSL